MEEPQLKKSNDNVRKKKVGRPSKKDLLSNKKGNRAVRGRPKGDAAIMNEYKARMLTSPKSEKVLEAIFNAALDDDHKHQAAAWKLIVDRVIPVGMFEKDVMQSNGRNAIQINISGIGGVADVSTVNSNDADSDIVEAEFTEED